MDNYESEIPTTKLISLQDLKEIMEKRTILSTQLLGKSCYLTVDRITKETPFLNRYKQQIFTSISPEIAMYQKTVFCRSYTLKEVEDKDSKDYLAEAYKLEKLKNYKEADLAYRSYLAKVQFRFTLLSNSNLYNSIKPGDTIIGSIDKYSTNRGEFLTMQSSTVRYK